jgi:hypothetical protein
MDATSGAAEGASEREPEKPTKADMRLQTRETHAEHPAPAPPELPIAGAGGADEQGGDPLRGAET